MRYNNDMQFAPHSAQNPDPNPTPKMNALAPAELIELVVKQEHEIVNLRRQVAWFQRQIFGQKSERRVPEADGVQGTLGEAFDAIAGAAPPNQKTIVASHARASKPNQPTDGADESSLFFDDQKVPVEVINAPNLEVECDLMALGQPPLGFGSFHPNTAPAPCRAGSDTTPPHRSTSLRISHPATA